MDRKKKKMLLVVLAALACLVGVVLFSESKRVAKNVGNEQCPVTGRPVDGVNTYTHEGKEYNLCSPDCAKSMSESPQEYVEAQDNP